MGTSSASFRDDREKGRLATTLTMAVLVGANMAPLVGVLFFEWKVFEVLALFWLENVFIGVLNVLRMGTILFLRRAFETIFLIPFFCVHYGMFTLVHGVFVMGMFGPKDEEGNPVFDSMGDGSAPFDDPVGTFLPMLDGLYWAAAALFLSHFFSYVVHFLMRGEYAETNGGELMSKPYGRVVILHVTILLGGGLAMATGESIYALVMLVLLKIAIDIGAHRKQHLADGKTGAKNDRVKGPAFSFGLGPARGRISTAFTKKDVGAAAGSGFTIDAIRPHPQFERLSPLARRMFGFIGGMLNVDIRGEEARGGVHKYIKSMKADAKRDRMVPESLSKRIEHLGIRAGTTLKMLLDDDTVIGYNFFENRVDVHGPNARDKRNIEAAIALAEMLGGFEHGVRISASEATIENDLADSLRDSELEIR